MKQISANEWLECAGTYKDKIVKNIGHLAKDNLDQLLHNLRQGAMSLLSIPTHKDLSKLQRKLAKMESRLNALDSTEKFPHTV